MSMEGKLSVNKVIGGTLVAQTPLAGTLNKTGGINGSLSGVDSFGGGLSIPKDVGADPYDGVVEITPSADPVVLSTKRKLVKDDIRVNAIPYYEISNEYGTTVNIGG